MPRIHTQGEWPCESEYYYINKRQPTQRDAIMSVRHRIKASFVMFFFAVRTAYLLCKGCLFTRRPILTESIVYIGLYSVLE